MERQIPDSPCDRSGEERELIRRFGPVLFKSTESGLQASDGMAAVSPTATHCAREMLNVANLVFAFMECKAGGDQELLYLLRLGERALSRVGDLLSG